MEDGKCVASLFRAIVRRMLSAFDGFFGILGFRVGGGMSDVLLQDSMYRGGIVLLFSEFYTVVLLCRYLILGYNMFFWVSIEVSIVPHQAFPKY